MNNQSAPGNSNNSGVKKIFQPTLLIHEGSEVYSQVRKPGSMQTPSNTDSLRDISGNEHRDQLIENAVNMILSEGEPRTSSGAFSLSMNNQFQNNLYMNHLIGSTSSATNLQLPSPPNGIIKKQNIIIQGEDNSMSPVLQNIGVSNSSFKHNTNSSSNFQPQSSSAFSATNVNPSNQPVVNPTS